MTVVNWVASDTASWILFSIGVLSTALAIVVNLFPIVSRRRRILLFFEGLSVWSPAVVGPLLLLGGAVLTGTGVGRLSWLSIFSGAVCLLVFGYLLLIEDVRRLTEADRRSQRELKELLQEEVRLRPYAKLQSRQYLDDELAERMSNRISVDVIRMLDPYRNSSMPSSSAIAGEVYQKLTQRGVLPSRTVESFEDFAKSMVRSGSWAPVSVYISADDGAGLKDAVVAVLREFGLETAVEQPPVQGSWFQRFWVRSRAVAESKPVRERLAKLERALELEGLGMRQAEIDKAKAESVAALYEVVKEQENAVVRMGSIIMIKTAGDLVVWTIGEMQAAALEKDSELLRDPVAALKFLRGGTRVQESIGLEPPGRDTLND